MMSCCMFMILPAPLIFMIFVMARWVDLFLVVKKNKTETGVLAAGNDDTILCNKYVCTCTRSVTRSGGNNVFFWTLKQKETIEMWK